MGGQQPRGPAKGFDDAYVILHVVSIVVDAIPPCSSLYRRMASFFTVLLLSGRSEQLAVNINRCFLLPPGFACGFVAVAAGAALQ